MHSGPVEICEDWITIMIKSSLLGFCMFWYVLIWTLRTTNSGQLAGAVLRRISQLSEAIIHVAGPERTMAALRATITAQRMLDAKEHLNLHIPCHIPKIVPQMFSRLRMAYEGLENKCWLRHSQGQDAKTIEDVSTSKANLPKMSCP